MTSLVDTLENALPGDDAPVEGPPPVPRLALVVGAVGRALIISGIVVLLFVVFQLWGTNIQEARAQSGLRGDLDTRLLEARPLVGSITASPAVVDAGSTDETPDALPVPATTSTLPGGYDPDVLAFFFPEDGEAVARIEIPAIDVDKIVVNGVQVADLRKGPGHYPSTALAGNTGNTAIAGHRTTYGAPFNRIDELQPGDEITVTGVLGRFTYRVVTPEAAFGERATTAPGLGDGHTIVRPSDTWVLGDFGDNRVTLTACHPKLSARQRIIVAAVLQDDPVELPDWADTAIAAASSGEDAEAVQATLGADEDEDAAATGEDDDVVPVTRPAAISLDEGLDGERDAIPGAVGWMVGAIGFWVLGGVMGRRLFDGRWPRAGSRLVALLPAATCLWFSFEMIDRALPAG